MQTRLLLRSLNRIFVFGINRTSGPSCRVLKQIRYETEKNNRYNNSAGGARPVAEDLGEDQHASRRDHNDNTRLVSPPLRGEQRRGLRDADRVDGGHRLGKVAADRVPNGHDRTSGLLHPLSGASRQGYAQRGDDRPRNDTRGRDRQPDRFGVLRRALLAVDAARGSALRRRIRNDTHGQGSGHVLLSAVPMEQCPVVALVSGRRQQLLLRRGVQSGRRIHFGGRGVSAAVSLQVLSGLTVEG